MKAWAKSFYLSAAWEKTRAAYLMSQDYICERCGPPAKIVHHKRWLNRENINDISVTLCWDNLIGNLSAELAGDLARKYPKARYTAEILDISGGGGTDVRVQYRA